MKYKSNNSLVGIVYKAKKYKQGHGILKTEYWCRREIREKTNHKKKTRDIIFMISAVDLINCL
jgi:hypothetical protein